MYQFGDTAFFEVNDDEHYRLGGGQVVPLPEGWQAAGVTNHGVIVLGDNEMGIMGASGAFLWRGYRQEHLDDYDMILAGREEIIVEDYDEEQYVAIAAQDGTVSGQVKSLPYSEYGSYDFESPPSSSDFGRFADQTFDVAAGEFLPDGTEGIVSNGTIGVVVQSDDATYQVVKDGRLSELTLPDGYFPIGLCGSSIVTLDEIGSITVLDLEGNETSVGYVPLGSGEEIMSISVDGADVMVLTEIYGADSESTDYAYTVRMYGPG